MALFSRSKKIDTDPQKISRLLSRAVEEIFVRESLERKLRSGKELRVKLGIDPTSPNMHIGRAIVLWKLREFQDLGHKVVFIVGDFTARVGDPSDKLAKRPMLTAKQIKENLKTYREQVGKIIDLSKAEFHVNSKWLSKLTFLEIADLAECFSVQQMSHRRNFAERMERGEEISLQEFLYPLMQGYDSVAVKADVELGGIDQLFNLKAGRVIQKHYGLPEQDILVGPMLLGTDGRKMSSSWGNVININDYPKEMYGKVMSLRDELVIEYFKLCTRLSDEEIFVIGGQLSSGGNPRDAKMRLAFEIVKLYHGEEKAKEAEENFISVFQKGAAPAEAEEVHAQKGAALSEILVGKGIVHSKSEWQRIVRGGGAEIVSGGKITDPRFSVNENILLRVGKKRFVKIILD